jgi:hypothetical protein
MTNTSRSGNARALVGNILINLLGVALVGSAIAKFARAPKLTSQLAMLGFDGGKLMFIAVLELASAVLLLIPRTRAIGLLFASAYLGGAMATHLGHNLSPIQPAIVLVLLWVGAQLRHPEVLWSFHNQTR